MNSSASWTLRIRDKVYKALAKFPSNDRRRITEVIEKLPLDPYIGDVEKMRDEENAWRRRVGVFRIFYEILPHDRVIYVFHVERRTSKTY